MSGDTQNKLHDLYGEILSSATKLQDSLETITGDVDMRRSPSELAFVTTLHESLGELSVVATIAYERGSTTSAP